MKKVFISCPIEGRTTENIAKTIEKMQKCAEAALGEEIMVIAGIVTDKAPSGADKRIWTLGESLKVLSVAGLFVSLSTAPYYFKASECEFEAKVATAYGIKELRIGGDCFGDFCPDLVDALKLKEAVKGLSSEFEKFARGVL